jgi:FMN phosphatase YigB (HAD superfamily)
LSSSEVAAISFDLDGTLYRVRRLRVAVRLYSDRHLLVALLAARERIRREPALEDGAALFRRQVDLVAPTFGWTTAETERRLLALGERLPAALTRGMRPFRGVKEALLQAKAAGLKLAVLSDYAPAEKLRWLGLDALGFDAAIGADATGALKPHARSFEVLASALSLPPDSILHIGDREDLDVEGALAAGLRTWRFAPAGEVNTKAEHQFRQWHAGLFSPISGEPT